MLLCTLVDCTLVACLLNGPCLAPKLPPQLNELHNGLLMACAADGAVRIWRNYAVRGQQRLASAWQAVLVPPAGGAGLRPAVYHWSPGYSALFAAGGRSAGECVRGWLGGGSWLAAAGAEWLRLHSSASFCLHPHGRQPLLPASVCM